MNVGENIRKTRLNAGFTQKALGERCGMAESAIRKYELGMANPKIETIQRIAKALNVDTLTLIGFEKYDKQNPKRSIKSIEKSSYIYLFSQADEHTQELFSKYMQLDARGQKAVESVLLSELNSIKDSRK